jgi:hypothetical protein
MAVYRIEIQATLAARNIQSANKKLQDLKHRIDRKDVDWSAIELVPEKKESK